MLKKLILTIKKILNLETIQNIKNGYATFLKIIGYILYFLVLICWIYFYMFNEKYTFLEEFINNLLKPIISLAGLPVLPFIYIINYFSYDKFKYSEIAKKNYSAVLIPSILLFSGDIKDKLIVPSLILLLLITISLVFTEFNINNKNIIEKIFSYLSFLVNSFMTIILIRSLNTWYLDNHLEALGALVFFLLFIHAVIIWSSVNVNKKTELQSE